MENIEIKAKLGLLWLLLKYQQWISSSTVPKCRFYPSCSNYSIEVIKGNSLIYAIFLIVKRLLKCRPGGPSGLDWPPQTRGNICNKNHG